MILPTGIRGWLLDKLLFRSFHVVMKESETPLEALRRLIDELAELRELKGRSLLVTEAKELQLKNNIPDEDTIDLYHAGLANGLILADAILQNKSPEFVRTVGLTTQPTKEAAYVPTR